jgi:hypothetical protein
MTAVQTAARDGGCFVCGAALRKLKAAAGNRGGFFHFAIGCRGKTCGTDTRICTDWEILIEFILAKENSSSRKNYAATCARSPNDEETVP